MLIPYTREELRAGDARASIAQQRAAVLLHPPDRLPRRRADGHHPARGAGRGRDRGVAVGRLPRRRRRRRRRAREGLELAAHQRRLADPAREGLGPVPQQRAREDRERARPATRRGSCSTSTGSSPRAPARTSTSCATGSSARRPRRPGSSTASTATSVIQIARDQGYEVVERDVARAELYLADELFMTGTAAELTPIREIDDHVDRRRRARPDHDAAAERLRGRAPRARPALRGVERRRARGEPQGGGVACASSRSAGELPGRPARADARARRCPHSPFRTRGPASP